MARVYGLILDRLQMHIPVCFEHSLEPEVVLIKPGSLGHILGHKDRVILGAFHHASPAVKHGSSTQLS
jgi:hypothetical protein